MVRKCACAWLCAGDVNLFCVLRRRKGWTISLLAAALSKRNELRRWWGDEIRGIPHALSCFFFLWQMGINNKQRQPQQAKATAAAPTATTAKCEHDSDVENLHLTSTYKIGVVCNIDSVAVHSNCCSTQRCCRGNAIASFGDLGRTSMPTQPDPGCTYYFS